MPGIREIEQSAEQSRAYDSHQHKLSALLRRFADMVPNGTMVWEHSSFARRAADHAVKQHPRGFQAPDAELLQLASAALTIIAQTPR